ncbi:MAG TPA: TIGR02186 family protein [Thermohalobaculum sp.]|nr:TIGR02186 family protein [Thermohalobaculum sp.]
MTGRRVQHGFRRLRCLAAGYLRLAMLTLYWMAVATVTVEAGEERVLAGLSQTHVSITTDFSGSEIFIYGAIKRDTPVPKEWPLDVIVAVTGPLEPVIVRKKERRFGVWVNDAGVKVDAAPSLYAIATTGPYRDVISFTDDFRYKVGIEHLVRFIGETDDVEFREGYPEALVRLRRAQGAYFERIGSVTVTEETLFETRIQLPANLVEGDYKTRIFLLRNKTVLDVFESSIEVRKVGLERLIYTMAQEQSALYGILSIVVALTAGWLASAFFRLIFR